MKNLIVVACFMLAFVGSMLPTGALAEERFSARIRQEAADAFWETTDAAGVETFVYVLASDDPSLPTGSFAYVTIFRFDPNCEPKEENPCTALVNLEGYADIDPDAFVIDGHLASARLSATVEVYDYLTDTTRTLEIDLSWTGTSAVFRTVAHFHEKTPEYTLHRHFNGTQREAVTAGTVLDGTSNFTPEPTERGAIFSLKFGEIVIS
jgi:hypothetical protein